MKIFFLTQYCVELYKPVYEEMLHQGHEVYLVQDTSLPFDYNHRRIGFIKRIILKTCRFLCQTEKQYWKKMIAANPKEYNKAYDLFFCIDGTSFHPCLLDHLKKYNSNIKASLYLWDSNKFYNFFRYNNLYDRIMTFDLDDAEKTPGVEPLPSFWFESPQQPEKYCLSIVGSDHDDRLAIVEKVYKQLKEANLKCDLKVVVFHPKELPDFRKYLGYFKKIYGKKCEIYEKKKLLPYTTTEPQSMSAVIKLIDESSCVLDTDMPVQVGATERVIWALARGKKIVSTNYNLKKMPFYNSEQFRFIDRENPVLDIDFIKDATKFPVSEYLQKLRIDRWVHTMIDFN